MGFKKCPPTLEWWLPTSGHVLGDGGLRHMNAEFQQLSMNARRSPQWIGQTHFSNEIPNFAGHYRSTLWMSTLPSPISRNPFRCQAITVSGLTMTSADGQPVHRRETQTHRIRSTAGAAGQQFRPAEQREFGSSLAEVKTRRK